MRVQGVGEGGMQGMGEEERWHGMGDGMMLHGMGEEMWWHGMERLRGMARGGENWVGCVGDVLESMGRPGAN